MDAITLLKNDHKTVEQLFTRFEKAGDRAFVEKRKIADRIIEELSVHAAIEEQVFYPVARATVPGTEGDALESLEEHHVAKWLLHELESMDAQDERFDAKMTVLIENVRHHIEEEEQEFFPKVRDELGRSFLGDIGDAMENARTVAPTRPHPQAPDTPPANLVTGFGAGVVDRVGDTVSGVVQGSVTALGDIIDTVLRRDTPRSSPTGSTVARKSATKVRSEVADATQAVIDAVTGVRDRGEDALDAAEDMGSEVKSGARRTARSAKRSATRTSKAAVAGAKGTATSAKKGAGQTKSSAKRAATNTGRTARSGADRTAGTAKRSASKAASRGRDAA